MGTCNINSKDKVIEALTARLEAADKRIAELKAAQRWIPVGERPPEGYGEEYGEEYEVLTLDEHGGVEGFPASHIPIWNGHHPNQKITHWMPIPDPPRKDDEA